MGIEGDFRLANGNDKQQGASGRQHAPQFHDRLEVAVRVDGIPIPPQPHVLDDMHARE